MNTENLSTLKIHKLTQAQYDRELRVGRVDENALYLTPDNDANVLYTEQSLTEEQKLQARTNIGVGEIIASTLVSLDMVSGILEDGDDENIDGRCLVDIDGIVLVQDEGNSTENTPIILTSPNGTRYQLVVEDNGTLFTVAMPD